MTTAGYVGAPGASELDSNVPPAPTITSDGRTPRVVALAVICLVAGLLYAWRIGSDGWGNTFYSAAVKSMSASVQNFLFGSFDPVGVVTVDKPPMGLWPQVFGTWIFGVHGWVVLLPQVIEGVAAVFLLHRTVRRWAGEPVALLAALVLALTPITVAINADNNPDTMLVLLLVAAAYAFTRSVEAGAKPASATRWLLLAGFFIGCGFVTKMMQAWIVVPVFALAYLVGSQASWRRRALDLLGAAVSVAVSSLWWVALVDLWPGRKPYIGGSTDGSAWNLVIGYNGLGRILGENVGRQIASGSGGSAGFNGPGGPGGGPFGGGTGITRMFDDQVGGQISWLLPLSLLVLVVVAVAGVRRRLAGLPARPERRAGWWLWGGWLLLTAAVFSFAQGIFHPYYTTMLAPAVAALSAAGLAELWRYYRQPAGSTWLLLPGTVILTAVWAWIVVSRDTSWNGWVRYAVAVVALLAVVLLVGIRLASGQGAGLRRLAAVSVVVAVLLAPGAWSAATAFAASGSPMGGVTPAAGPPMSMFGRGGVGGLRSGQPGRNGGMPGTAGGQGGMPNAGQFAELADELAKGEVPTQLRGMQRGEITDQQRKILSYAEHHAAGARITLAVEGGANAASGFILGSNDTVIGMGGFMGSDPAPTVDQLATWVQHGELRFVLAGGGRDGGGPPGAGGNTAGTPQGSGSASGPAGGSDTLGVAAQRDQWVRQHCIAVDPRAYGGTAPSSQQTHGGGMPSFFGGVQQLYECRAN
jgi:4-amino-4-deoxy-L-arabinose transferase-like glycosyltransferase